MWSRLLSPFFRKRVSHIKITVFFASLWGLVLGACNDALPTQQASMILDLKVTPAFDQGEQVAELSLWTTDPDPTFPLWIFSDHGLPSSTSWKALTETLHLKESTTEKNDDPISQPAHALYQAKGLWRHLTAISLPNHIFSLEGFDGTWLDDKLNLEVIDHDDLLNEPKTFLYPLPELDYRVQAISLSPQRQTQVLLSPWHLLSWLIGPDFSVSYERQTALATLIQPLLQHTNAWSTLAYELSLPQAWSLVQLIARLVIQEQTDLLQKLGRELALHTFVYTDALDTIEPIILRGLPCIFKSLLHSEELNRFIEQIQDGDLPEHCALPQDLLWIKASPYLWNAPFQQNPTISIQVETLQARPMQVIFEYVNTMHPEWARYLALDEEQYLSLRQEHITALDHCEGEGTNWSCELKWDDFEGSSHFILVSVLTADGQKWLGARLLRYPLVELPAWQINLGALARPRLVDDLNGSFRYPSLIWHSLSSDLDPFHRLPTSQVLPMNQLGLASLSRQGRSAPLLFQVGLTEELTSHEHLELWSPYPAPGHWRSYGNLTQLEGFLSERLLLEMLFRAPLEKEVLSFITPLSTKVTKILSNLSSNALNPRNDLLEFGEDLIQEILESLGGQLTLHVSPTLAQRIEAFFENPSQRSSIIKGSIDAQQLGYDRDEIAQFRAWLCLEAAEQSSPEPEMLYVDELRLMLKPIWLEWFSLGCLLGSLSLEHPAYFDRFQALDETAVWDILSDLHFEDTSPHLVWLTQLLGALSDPPYTEPAWIELQQMNEDQTMQSIAVLDQEFHELGEIQGKPHLLYVESPMGIASITIEYVDAPWLAPESTIPEPTPNLSARLYDEEMLTQSNPLRSDSLCLWKHTPLDHFGGQWRLDSNWRQTHPITDPQWIFTRSQEAMTSQNACSVAFMLDGEKLPEGAYLIRLELRLAWGGTWSRQLSFKLDRSPLHISLEAQTGFLLLDQDLSTQEEVHTHVHLGIKEPIFNNPNDLIPIGMVRLNRPAHCELTRTPSTEQRPPLLSVHFSADQNPLSALTLTPQSTSEPAEQWLIQGKLETEGSGRYALRCENERGEIAHLTLDVTFDSTPALLRAVWLTQVDESTLNSKRLTDLAEPLPIAWLLFVDELPLIERLLPEHTYNLYDNPSSGIPPIERWRGWWGKSQCTSNNSLNAQSSCLFSDEGLCMNERLQRCLKREYPLTLHALVEDEQWEVGVPALELIATLIEDHDTLTPYVTWKTKSEAYGRLTHVQIQLKEGWIDHWPEPSFDKLSELTLRMSVTNPLHQDTTTPFISPNLVLNTLIPPPRINIETQELPQSDLLEDLNLLKMPSLMSTQVYNPHRDALWIKPNDMISILSLQAHLDRVEDALVVPLSISFYVFHSCLWNHDTSYIKDHLLVNATEMNIDQLTMNSCSFLNIPRTWDSHWEGRLEWVVTPHLEALDGWYRLPPKGELTLTLQSTWALPDPIDQILNSNTHLAAPRENHYVYAEDLYGFFWGENRCINCEPSLVFGVPYSRLTMLSITSENSLDQPRQTWSLDVCADLDGQIGPTGPSSDLASIPSLLRYELNLP